MGSPRPSPPPVAPELTALQQGLQVCLGLRPIGLAHSNADLHTSGCQSLQLPEDLLALEGGDSFEGMDQLVLEPHGAPHGIVLRLGF